MAKERETATWNARQDVNLFNRRPLQEIECFALTTGRFRETVTNLPAIIMFDRVIEYLEKYSRLQAEVLNLIGMCTLPLITITVTADVIGRYFFNHPIAGALDLSELLLVVVVCFALAYTAALKGHMSVEVVTSRLSSRARAILSVLMGLTGLPVLLLLTFYAALDGINTYKSGLETSILHMPIYPFRFVVAIGFFALSLELICQWLRSIERLLGGKNSST